jgi:tRNA(fMet)-specific endonuclease VapC
MTRYLLDTNHASLLLRRIPQITDRVRTAVDVELFLCRPSVAELWFMIFKGAKVDANRAELEVFLRDFRHVEFDAAAAVEFGRIKAHVRKIGKPMPDVDIQIAAIARVNNLVLLTDDAHFNSVPGMTLQNWVR